MARISIALCTCNGERYLPDQLQSYLDQHRRPDEVIVCDDLSEDETPAILENFAAKAPFPVRVERNTTRLGITANFSRAVSLCTGDFIALSDQDDVWLPEKLKRLESALLANPSAAGTFSDASLVATNLAPLGRTIWETVGFCDDGSPIFAGPTTDLLVKRPVVTGATLLVRSNLRELALPIPDDWVHDQWLAMLAAAQGGLTAVTQPLVLYRQHGANAIGGLRPNLFIKLRHALRIERGPYLDAEITRFTELVGRLSTSGHREDRSLAPLTNKLAHLRRRRAWPRRRLRRWPFVLREWASGGYHRYARNWHSILFDLLAPDGDMEGSE